MVSKFASAAALFATQAAADAYVGPGAPLIYPSNFTNAATTTMRYQFDYGETYVNTINDVNFTRPYNFSTTDSADVYSCLEFNPDKIEYVDKTASSALPYICIYLSAEQLAGSGMTAAGLITARVYYSETSMKYDSETQKTDPAIMQGPSCKMTAKITGETILYSP